MNVSPLITIVIPAYNHENYVEASILSVLNQTYKHIELIVINDGSSDNTHNIIQQMLEQHSGAFQYINKENEGVSSTLNLGLSLAKGEIFHYLASDDMLHPQACTHVANQFDIMPEEAGLLFCRWTDDSEVITQPAATKDSIDKGYVWEDILSSKLDLLGPVCFFRTEALRETGGFRSGLALEDFYVLLKVCYHYKTYFYPETLVFHRMHDHNSGQNYRRIGPAAIETANIFFKEMDINNPALQKESILRIRVWLAWAAFHNKDRSFSLQQFFHILLMSPMVVFGDSHFFKAFIRTLFNIFK